MALAFNTNGSQGSSNPFTDLISGLSPNTKKPISSALASSQQPDWLKSLNAVLANTKTTTPANPTATPPPNSVVPKTAGLLSVDTPVKKQSVTNPDGSVHTVEYHAPEAPKPVTQGSSTAAPKVGQAPTSYKDANGNTIDVNGNLIALSPENQAKINASSAASANNSNTFGGLVGNAASSANRNVAIGQDAANIAKEYGAKIADVGERFSKAQAGYKTTGTTPVAEGNAAVAANTAANTISALSAAESAALAGTGQQITAQGQTTSGLLGAAGVAAPSVAAYGQTTFNPLTGEYTGGSGGALNPLNNISSLATQVINGQISPAQAYAMGGNVANFQGALNAEIQRISPNFNTAAAQGAYDAKQSNVTTAGTAPTSAAASVYGNTYGQMLDLQNTVTNIDQFGNLLLGSMATDKNGTPINPTDVKFANKTISQIRGELSSTEQAVFDNTYASLKSRVSGLLAAGGNEIPTQITADANKILDGSLPLKSLSAVLNRIATEGRILVSNVQQKLNTAGSVIGAPKAGNANNPLGI